MQLHVVFCDLVIIPEGTTPAHTLFTKNLHSVFQERIQESKYAGKLVWCDCFGGLTIFGFQSIPILSIVIPDCLPSLFCIWYWKKEDDIVIRFCLFRFLATGDSYTTIAFSYRVGLQTVCNIVNETCDAIWKRLQPLYMPSSTLGRHCNRFLNTMAISELLGSTRRKTCTNFCAKMFWFQFLQLQEDIFCRVTWAGWPPVLFPSSCYWILWFKQWWWNIQEKSTWKEISKQHIGHPMWQATPSIWGNGTSASCHRWRRSLPFRGTSRPSSAWQKSIGTWKGLQLPAISSTEGFGKLFRDSC